MSTADVARNKAAIIERCVRRAREVHAGDPANLRNDLTRQDSIVLNIQRTCEAAVDLAMHLARIHHLGILQDSRSAFELLVASGHLEPGLGATLQRMVGFRDVAVHDYQRLNLDVVEALVVRDLDDLLAFASSALRAAAS